MKPVFSVKSAHLDALAIQLHNVEIDAIREALQEQINQYLKFKALPFILDVQQIEDRESVPFNEILALFALHELKIVGLRHSDEAWEHDAKRHNLVFLHEKITPPPAETPATENTESIETVAENAQTQPENTAEPSSEKTIDDEADAFARELFGDNDTVAESSAKPESESETNKPTDKDSTPHDDADILANDNAAIKTVEMAKPAELVELSPEEAQKLAEANSTELHSEDGEAKGEIVSISEAKQTIVVSTPVRTGQQIYAEKADLIVLGIVSPGAEVIADGNIHIYAPLRGRALAGASGDRKARIFVQSMQAELVSIAGIYRTFEQKLPNHLSKQAVRIELQDDRLAISSIVAE